MSSNSLSLSLKIYFCININTKNKILPLKKKVLRFHKALFFDKPCVGALMCTYCIRLESNFYMDVIFNKQGSASVHLTDSCFMSLMCMCTSVSRGPAEQSQRAAREEDD